MHYNRNRNILLGVIFLMVVISSVAFTKQLLEDWQLLTSSTVNETRYHHEAMALNGNVYIIDGQANFGVYFNSIERAAILPDGTLGQWTTVSQNSESRCYFSAVTVGNWLYLIGGENGGYGPYQYSNVERAEILLDGTFSQWTIIRQLPVYIFKHAAVSYGKYIYLLGGVVAFSDSVGYDSNSVFRAEVYPDGSISEFTAETAAMQCLYRKIASAIIVGDNLYALCGYDGWGNWRTVERSKILPDGHLGTWQSMNSTIYMHIESRCAVAQDTYLFMVAGGGQYFDGQWNTPVEYATIDTAGNLSPWQLANLTCFAVWGSSAVLAYPYIYLPTGQNTTDGLMITDAVYTRFTPTAVKPDPFWELYQ